MLIPDSKFASNALLSALGLDTETSDMYGFFPFSFVTGSIYATDQWIAHPRVIAKLRTARCVLDKVS